MPPLLDAEGITKFVEEGLNFMFLTDSVGEKSRNLEGLGNKCTKEYWKHFKETPTI